MEATLAPPVSPKLKNLAVPNYLIYETLDGEPIYFQGYQQVLNGEKTKEDIMATGRLQTLIISTIQEHLWAKHNREGLKYMSNEVGIHISTGLNFSCDLKFGVEQVIWILTASKTVTVGTPDGTFITRGWDRPIEIFKGHSLVLADLFQENGIKIKNI